MQLELLAAAILTVVLLTALAAGTDGYIKQQRKVQLMTAANMLAEDIRTMQQQSIFSDRVLNRQLRVAADSGGYDLYKDRKVVRKIVFSERGCADVYFGKKITQVHFTNTGSPSSTGDFELRHRRLTGYKYIVSIQPVTGRVVVSEGK